MIETGLAILCSNTGEQIRAY